VPIGIGALAAGLRVLPGDAPTDTARRLDLRGVTTLSVALLLIVVPLVLGRQEHWPPWTWASLAAGAPAVATFVAVQRRVMAGGGSPLVNLDVLRRRAIAWGLLAQAVAVSTYFALLFTLAIYLQDGLGRSPVASGLTLVSWVVAFGVPGRLIGRLPSRLGPLAAPAGCLILGAAYLGISLSLFAGHHAEGLLVALLGVGGLGLGTAFSAILGHLTAAVTPRNAADISGVFTTVLQVAGAIGVATFGTIYLGLVTAPGSASATHAFAVVTAAFAIAAVVAAAMAYRATSSPGRVTRMREAGPDADSRSDYAPAHRVTA
jgi:predicted MFS family arabinose efflux permease